MSNYADNYKQLVSCVEMYCPDFLPVIASVCSNKTHDSIPYLGLIEAPAGVGMHHAYIGGLVTHYLEMWAFYINNESPFKGIQYEGDVLRAIILHDLHKAHYCFTVKGMLPDGCTPNIEYGEYLGTRAVSANMRSLHIALSAGGKVNDLVLNSLCNAEGGWAKDPSRLVSSFAKYIYLLDEISSNVIATENERITERGKKYKCRAGDLQ